MIRALLGGLFSHVRGVLIVSAGVMLVWGVYTGIMAIVHHV